MMIVVVVIVAIVAAAIVVVVGVAAVVGVVVIVVVVVGIVHDIAILQLLVVRFSRLVAPNWTKHFENILSNSDKKH